MTTKAYSQRHFLFDAFFVLLCGAVGLVGLIVKQVFKTPSQSLFYPNLAGTIGLLLILMSLFGVVGVLVRWMRTPVTAKPPKQITNAANPLTKIDF
jgi:ABC-type transport system involved in multi-copper enzyme maturation permease subunit